MRRRWRGWAWGLGALLAWEALYRAGLINPLLIGAPSLILASAMKDGPTFLGALRVTTFEIAGAAAACAGFGVAAGLLIGANPRLTRALRPFLSGALAAPLVVLYPVVVAFAGVGPPSKIVYGALAGVFPIALAAAAGVTSIDRGAVVMAKSFGATRRQVLVQVIAPLALPSIVAGLRVGLSLAIIAVVQSEMLSSTDGLGFWISYYRATFAVGDVYFGITLVLIVAAFVNVALARLERRLSVAA